MREQTSEPSTRTSLAAAADARWLGEAIELMSSLAEKVHYVEAADADEAAFAAARTALKQIDFSATAFCFSSW